jgi:hypothetical protein
VHDLWFRRFRVNLFWVTVWRIQHPHHKQPVLFRFFFKLDVQNIFFFQNTFSGVLWVPEIQNICHFSWSNKVKISISLWRLKVCIFQHISETTLERRWSWSVEFVWGLHRPRRRANCCVCSAQCGRSFPAASRDKVKWCDCLSPAVFHFAPDRKLSQQPNSEVLKTAMLVSDGRSRNSLTEPPTVTKCFSYRQSTKNAWYLITPESATFSLWNVAYRCTIVRRAA